MAKKWKDKEINEYLKTKQISQENYVAPTVEIGTAPSYKSVANTVDTFNNVSNNIKNKTTMSFDDKEPTTGQKLGFIGKSAGAGLTSGLTGIVDAPLQNIQEGAQKGKKKGKLENYLQGLARTLDIYGLSTMPETAKEVQQIVQDKNKKGWEKALNIGGTILNNNPLTNNLESAGQQLNIVDKNAEKDIANVRKKIETPSNKLNESVAKDSEKMSGGWKIAGEVSQTIGNMIPSMALTAVTKNPDIGLAAMGVSAKGQATKEAEEKGSDLSTANEIGLGKGLVEVGTEKLTGGLKFFGKGTADDLVEKGINKAIKNKVGNFIAKQAVGMAGEVGEETISDLVGTAIDKATVDPDASYSFDDWKKTALMTMLSTGALNTISGGYGRKAYQLNAEELNDIAQSKKVQDTVNERVENFKTPDMTPEQVEQLREQTTAVVLGEIQQNVDDILDSSIAQLQEQPQIPTQTPINAISSNIQEQNIQTPFQEQTPQITPLNQVNQELQETRQNDIANQVQAMNLEQEPEFTQKQGNYVYEKSDNSKIDNLRKDAANYLKEGEQTTNFVNTLEKLVKDKDIEIRFDTKLGNNVNGTYKDGVITINPNSNRAGEFVAIHELTHAIGTKPMIDMIQTYRNSNAEFNNAVERLLSTYKTTEINEEALGDIAGQLFGNQEYINNLSMENPSLFKKIYNEIKYLWHQFTGYKNQNQFIEDLRNKWESAYRNQKVQQKAKNSNIEMSNQTDSNGNMLSNEQVQYFKDSKVRDENGNLIPVYHGSPNEFTVFDKGRMKTGATLYASSGDGFYFTDNETKANKYSKGGYKYSTYLNLTNPFVVENNLSNEASNILTEFSHQIIDTHPEATQKDFGAYEVFDKNDIGQQSGTAILSGVVSEYGDEFTKFLKNKGYDGIKSSVTDYDNYGEKYNYVAFEPNQIKNIDNLTPTQDDDIRYSKEEITKDNTGRKLSKEQQKYFKDSKVRDNNGNLEVVYHTTTNSGTQFNEFNPVGTPGYRFGDQVVNYFTNSKDMSGSYADQKYEMADTQKFNNIDEVKNWLKEQKTLFDEYDIKPTLKEGAYFLTENGQGKILFETEDKLLKEVKKKFYEYKKQFGSDKGYAKRQYEGYINITNPYVVDAEERNWNQVVSQSNDFIDNLEERVPQDVKDNLTRLYQESANKSAEAREEYNITEQLINNGVDAYNSSVDDDIKKVNKIIKRVGYNEMEEVLNDIPMGVMGVRGWYNLADILKEVGVIGDATSSNIINDFKLPEDIKNWLKENYNKEIPMHEIQTSDLAKAVGQLGRTTTLKDIYKKNQESYNNFDKYRMPNSYFLEQLQAEGNDYLGYELEDLFEQRAEIKGAEVVADEISQAASVGFSKPEMIKLWGTSKTTNDVVKEIIASNKDGKTNYDGVIIKNVYDYGGKTDIKKTANDIYITFNSNQFKNIDNTNPTEDPDIRYSKDNQTWREYLEKEFPSQGTRTNLQDINERNKPKQENKTTQEEKPQEMPKKEVKQEVKKSYLTSAEQTELDGLKAVENSGFAELTKKEQARMEELEKKSQGYTKKFPELSKTVTQEDTKPLYFKYKDNEISRENNKILNEAKKIVESNKQGRRTKEQWLQVAEYIGSNADIKSSTDLQKLAMETWLASRPNTKDNLNRQGKKYVDFKTNEWFNAMYKGAGVGTDVKMSLEEKNTINESKQDEVVVLRTPTEIQPKEVKTPEQKQEYFEESGTPKKVAKILSETPRETETSTLREKYQTLKRAVVDKGEAIYRIAKQTKNRRLYAMYDRIGLATGEGNSDIGISQTNLDGESYKNFTDSKGNKTSMSLNDIWKDVEDSNIPENVMNEYLANYLNVDRYKANQLSIEEIEELKDLNKYKNLSKTQKERVEELNTLAETRNVFGKDITREDSLNKIKEIEEKYPQIKRPAENIWQYGKNQLQKMVDAGLVSKESQEYYNENTPHYVRLQRSTESKKGSVFDSKGHLQVNNQIKKAKGGTKDIIPFKDSMAQYTLDTTSSIRKNLFGQELSKTLKNGLETDGNVDIDNIDNNILNANEDGSYTFKIFKDGKPEVLTIDKGIYEALQPNKHYELEKLFTPFRAVSNFKRTVLTDKNPLFLATNFFKDFFDAPLNTKHSTVDFVKNYGVAINQILKNGEYYQKYQALGGNQNTYFDKEGFSKPSKISKIVAPIEKANEFIEMLPRMSEFITSLKKGESLDEAMYNAAEITTNFKRGGTATKIVNRNGATFLNASVQGFDKQIRNFTEIQNPKQAVRLLTKALVLGVAPALLNAVMYDDDDEYEDLPDYVKDSYYLFKTGKDNKWIRIPKGRAISVIQAAARRTYNFSKGDKDAYKGLAGHFENQLAPNNPLESNVLSPLVDVKNNKAWSGNKIVSDSIANTSHPEEEYDAKTDELSKWLGQKLGKSPKKINYIIDQNTGAIGDLLLPFLTKQAEGEDDSIAGRLLKNPVKDKFTTDAVLNSKQVNQFYDAFNKAEDDKKWSKATDEDKLKYKYLYSTMLELAEKNKQIKEIESSDKSDKEKYRETKAIKQEMNDMSKKAVKESENIKINDYYAQIDDKVYKKEYDKSTGEYKYTKVQQKQLDKIKDKGVPLSDYFQEAYEKQKKRATK